jgi:hypothetical protein
VDDLAPRAATLDVLFWKDHAAATSLEQNYFLGVRPGGRLAADDWLGG